jgi:hypothetical protein
VLENARFGEAMLLAVGAHNFHICDHFAVRDTQFLVPRILPRLLNGSDKLQVVQDR